MRDEISLTRRIHATIGLAYQQMEYSEIGGDPVTVREADRWAPLVGAPCA